MLVESLTKDKQEKIISHLRLLIQFNKKVNLTRIDSEEDGLLLHVEDSLAALDLLRASPEGRYADLGSGGGFPGIPLAIASERPTTLVESVKKKATILELMTEELGVSEQIEVYPDRAENLAKEQNEVFSVITARALSSMSSILELASPLLHVGGWLICFKSNRMDKELEDAQKVCKTLGFNCMETIYFNLADSEIERSLVLFIKEKQADVALPRKAGLAQKRPYLA